MVAAKVTPSRASLVGDCLAAGNTYQEVADVIGCAKASLVQAVGRGRLLNGKPHMRMIALAVDTAAEYREQLIAEASGQCLRDDATVPDAEMEQRQAFWLVHCLSAGASHTKAAHAVGLDEHRQIAIMLKQAQRAEAPDYLKEFARQYQQVYDRRELMLTDVQLAFSELRMREVDDNA